MGAIRLYVLAALPAALCLLAWQGAAWTVEQLNCVVRGKELAGCTVYGLDLTGLLGIALFWGGILVIPAAFLSVILLAAVPSIRRRATNPTVETDARKNSARGSL